MVDISSFFDFYIKNDKYDIIKYGIEKSEFNAGIALIKYVKQCLKKELIYYLILI